MPRRSLRGPLHVRKQQEKTVNICSPPRNSLRKRIISHLNPLPKTRMSRFGGVSPARCQAACTAETGKCTCQVSSLEPPIDSQVAAGDNVIFGTLVALFSLFAGFSKINQEQLKQFKWLWSLQHQPTSANINQWCLATAISGRGSTPMVPFWGGAPLILVYFSGWIG